MRKIILFSIFLVLLCNVAIAGNNGQFSEGGKAVMSVFYPDKPNSSFSSNIGGFDWGNENNFTSSYFMEDPTAGQVVRFVRDTHDITFQPMALNYRNDLDQVEQINMVQSVIGQPSDDVFIYEDVYGSGIDLKYKYDGFRLKEELIIENRSDLPDPATYIINGGNTTIEMNFVFDSDEKIILDGMEWDKKTQIVTPNEVQVLDINDDLVYTFPVPKAYDSNNDEITGEYIFKKQGASLYVSIQIPYSWLNDSNTIYPVYIDPTIITINQDNVTLYITPENQSCEDIYCGSQILIRNLGDENISFNTSGIGVSIEGSIDNFVYYYDNTTGEDTSVLNNNEITLLPNETFVVGIKSTQEDYGTFKYNVSFDYMGETHLIDPYYVTAEDTTQSTTTSNAYQTKLSKTIEVTDSTKSYLIVASAELTSGTTASSVYARITIDGTPYSEYLREAKDSALTSDYPTYMTAVPVNLTVGNHTVIIQYASEINGVTSYIRNTYISAIQMDNYSYSQSLTQQSVAGTSYVTAYGTLTFTPPTLGNYLVMVTGEATSQATNKKIFVRSTVDAVQDFEHITEMKDGSDWVTFNTMSVESFDATSHTINVEAYVDGGGTGLIRDVRIIAVRLLNSEYYFNESNAETTTASTTWQTKTSYTFTALANVSYQYYARQTLSGETVTSSNGRLLINGVPYCDFLKEDQDDANYESFFCQKNLTLATDTIVTAEVQYRVGAGAGTVGSKEGRIVILKETQVDQQCNPTLNVDWVISDVQVCDAVEVTTGTGRINITATGSLELKNGANVTTTGFPSIIRASGLFDWRIMIERLSNLIMIR